jgi:hypothetical protein
VTCKLRLPLVSGGWLTYSQEKGWGGSAGMLGLAVSAVPSAGASVVFSSVSAVFETVSLTASAVCSETELFTVLVVGSVAGPAPSG